MIARFYYIARQSLIVLLALQLLNVSIGSQPSGDADYDYSYAYNKTYDPTETAVEWIVEMEYGQKADFTYTNHSNINKNIIKLSHWQPSPGITVLKAPCRPLTMHLHGEMPVQHIPSHIADIVSPPPELYPRVSLFFA